MIQPAEDPRMGRTKIEEDSHPWTDDGPIAHIRLVRVVAQTPTERAVPIAGDTYRVPQQPRTTASQP